MNKKPFTSLRLLSDQGEPVVPEPALLSELKNTCFDSTFVDETYLKLLRKLLHTEQSVPTRTGVRCFVSPCETVTYNLGEMGMNRIPLLHSKFVHYPSVLHELIWFLSGDTNVRYLRDNKVTIWDEWADADGNLGPVYGAQWRGFDGVDQLAQVEHLLRTDPFNRRMVVSAWNPSELDLMALPPCHYTWAVTVSPSTSPEGKNVLNMHVTQRSADVFLGVPFNIASYATLLHMLCAVHNFDPGVLSMTFVNAHLYENHVDQAWSMLEDALRIHQIKTEYRFGYPSLVFDLPKEIQSVADIQYSMVNFDPSRPYVYGRRIKAPVAV
jgi:thymidylate synthase